MKHVIIGTAGHVDHGKTMLVQALTGIFTDRLEEEKRRGITIELGFAHLDFADGLQAGIVDVPGHEKFIKNMLAGAGGIDLCMLVVAADEGFMPQTVEHLDIVSLLGIQDGLIVLTKKDLVDEEWLEMVREEAAARVKGTFLEGKPILAVSAQTGEGIEELRDCLHALVSAQADKNARIPFRLPIDRVFSVDGFGTVVTGTLIEGCMREGEPAQLAPSGAETRIRNLQVHGKDVDIAYAGQRVAVNLAGLRKTDIQRGDLVAKPGSVRVSYMLDVKLRNLPDSNRVIQNNSQVHLYHGVAVLLAKVILLDQDELQPGESGYAQLRMSEPIASKNGDHFVIRFYSPLETIGGGVILDDAPQRHKRHISAVLEALKIKESGTEGDMLYQTVAEFGTSLPDGAQIAAKLTLEQETLQRELQALLETGRIAEPLPGRFVAAKVLDALGDTCCGLLAEYHKKNPLHAGMKSAELRQKLCKGMEQTAADALLAELCRGGRIRRCGERYALSDFQVHFTKKQTAIKDKLLAYFQHADIEPDSVEDVIAAYPQNERSECKQVLDSLFTGGELVLLSPQICYHKDAFDKACRVVYKHFEDHELMTLAEFRDALGTSRKYAMAVLEYLDSARVTKKEGDARRLLKKL